MLQTYNASGRITPASSDQFTSFRIKTGKRRIIRPDELNSLVRL